MSGAWSFAKAGTQTVQGAKLRKADHTLATVADEDFEARKTQLMGDGKAGRWFPLL